MAFGRGIQNFTQKLNIDLRFLCFFKDACPTFIIFKDLKLKNSHLTFEYSKKLLYVLMKNI